jgi:Ca-activated chloride channel family protein
MSDRHFIFESPIFILFAVVFIVIVIIYRKRFTNILSISINLGPPGGVLFSPPLNSSIFLKLLNILECAAIASLFFAAAKPVFVETKTVYLKSGREIIFIIDTSPSMAGLDMPFEGQVEGQTGGETDASRFTMAKFLILDFAEKRPVDSIGIIACGNDAALILAPTTNRALLSDVLNNLKLGELGENTALGNALSVAALHLSGAQSKNDTRKICVLLSDGENNAGAIHPAAAASALGASGAILYVVGIGSKGTVPIDYTDPFTNIRRKGSFDSRFSSESLIEIADAANIYNDTSPRYFSAANPRNFQSAFEKLSDAEQVVERSLKKTEKQELDELFLFAGFAAFIFCRLVKHFILGEFI